MLDNFYKLYALWDPVRGKFLIRDYVFINSGCQAPKFVTGARAVPVTKIGLSGDFQVIRTERERTSEAAAFLGRIYPPGLQVPGFFS